MEAQQIINWFEIAVSDFARAKKFYETIFDIDMMVNETNGYRMAFFPAAEGKVSGAICFGEGYIPSGAGAMLYLNANPDINLVLERTTQAGGKIIVPKTAVGNNAGYYAFILDTEGNRLALHAER
ncbi:MAG: hypothetical protein RIQ62_902 [Bacteroidota bacterium]|jgi:predicted enzyme related to lactoylglutathione lyase